jgi:hypothetical protein
MYLVGAFQSSVGLMGWVRVDRTCHFTMYHSGSGLYIYSLHVLCWTNEKQYIPNVVRVLQTSIQRRPR